jgi:hypothetical protein
MFSSRSMINMREAADSDWLWWFTRSTLDIRSIEQS